VEQPEVRGDAGVGKDGEVRAPAECVPDLLNGCGRGAVGGVGGIAGAAKCVEAADAKVTAGETDWFAGGAPAIAREGGEEGLHGLQPCWRHGLVECAPRQECEGDEVAAVASEHGRGVECARASEEGCVRVCRVAQRCQAVAGGEADGAGGIHGKRAGRLRRAGGTCRRGRG